MNSCKERKRLYSWSRPSRELRKQGRGISTALNSEHSISGDATIAFHPSGEWFQGNILNTTGDAYTVHGRRRKDSTECSYKYPDTFPEEDREEAELVGERQEDRIHRESSTSTNSNDEDVSNCGSLDSSLVRTTLETLDLESINSDLYTVFVKDYETGIDHTIKDVVYSFDGDILRLEADCLEFSSTSTLKGNRADTVIATNLGPNLVDKELIVYRGEFKMTYMDEPCFPVSLDNTQWCL